MPSSTRRGGYHHGDLRTALMAVALDLIGEGDVSNFSMAEASRRLGVAVSAPYAHFSDRDDLLAALAVEACEAFRTELVEATGQITDPAERLAAMACSYVRFAGLKRPYFEVVFRADFDKSDHPEVAEAEQPLNEAFLDCVAELTGGEPSETEELVSAVEAAAHGHAMLLLDEGTPEAEAVELAARRAAATTLALVEGRRQLVQPAKKSRSRRSRATPV